MQLIAYVTYTTSGGNTATIANSGAGTINCSVTCVGIGVSNIRVGPPALPAAAVASSAWARVLGNVLPIVTCIVPTGARGFTWNLAKTDDTTWQVSTFAVSNVPGVAAAEGTVIFALYTLNALGV